MESIFSKRVMYRSYNRHLNNITGDLEHDSYTDYPIYCEFQSMSKRDQLMKFGHVRIGDAKAFFKGLYNSDSDGNVIRPALKPKKHDEILFNNKWYRIKNLIPEYWTEGNVLMYDCNMIFVMDEKELTPPGTVNTFFIIDHNGNFIIDNAGNNLVGRVS